MSTFEEKYDYQEITVEELSQVYKMQRECPKVCVNLQTDVR